MNPFSQTSFSKIFVSIAFIAAITIAGVVYAYVSPNPPAPSNQADTPIDTSASTQSIDRFGIREPNAGSNIFTTKGRSWFNSGFVSAGDVIVEGNVDATNNVNSLLDLKGHLIVQGDHVAMGTPGLIRDDSMVTLGGALRPVCATAAGELVPCGASADDPQVHSCFYWWEQITSNTTTNNLGDITRWSRGFRYNLSCHFEDTTGTPLSANNIEIEHLDFTSNSGWQPYNSGSVAAFGSRMTHIDGHQSWRQTTPVYWDLVSINGSLMTAGQYTSAFTNPTGPRQTLDLGLAGGYGGDYNDLAGMTLADFDQFSLTGYADFYSMNDNLVYGNLEEHAWRIRVSDGAQQPTWGSWVYLNTIPINGTVWEPRENEVQVTNVTTSGSPTTATIDWGVNTSRGNMYSEYFSAFPTEELTYVLLRCDDADQPAGGSAPCQMSIPGGGGGGSLAPQWGRVIDIATFDGTDIFESVTSSSPNAAFDADYFIGVLRDNAPVPTIGQTYGQGGGPGGWEPYTYGFEDATSFTTNMEIISF